MAKTKGKIKPRPDRPDAELREIAFDIRAGRLYTSAQVPQHLCGDCVYAAGAPPAAAVVKGLKEQGEQNAIKDGPHPQRRAVVNGYPMFNNRSRTYIESGHD